MKSSLTSFPSQASGSATGTPPQVKLGAGQSPLPTLDLNITLLTIWFTALAKVTRNITTDILRLFKTHSFLNFINGVHAQTTRHGAHDERAEGLVGGVADEMAAGFANGSGAG